MLQRSRNLQSEIMDQPDLDQEQLQHALSAVRRVNTLSFSANILWKEIHLLLKAKQLTKLSVLDLATGSGDIPISLWKKAKREGFELDITAVDINPRALSIAKNCASKEKCPIEFLEANALDYTPTKNYDVVCCSLFLHHLEQDDAARLLKKMAVLSKHLVLVNDLHRSVAGWLLAISGTLVLTRSRVAQIDGRRSVEGAFTSRELAQLAEMADLKGATVNKCWPCRHLLRWQKTCKN